jgi:hypothetical protein
MRRIRQRLTFANVVSVIALFVALSGGTAVALSGSNTVQSDDLGPGSQVTAPDVAANAVNGTDVVNGSIGGADIADFSLTNQDVGVLFAEVNSSGTLANSSGGGVTTVSYGSGNYDVDFARNVAACTAVATLGPSTGAILPPGEVSLTDTPGNAESVSVITWNSDGTSANKPFRLVVVC